MTASLKETKLCEEAKLSEEIWQQWGVDHMREMECKWKQRGDCFSWIDPEPTYWCVSDWYQMNPSKGEDGLVEIHNPQFPCRRIMRFSMLGGGQIRTTEHFKATPSHWLTLLDESPTYPGKIDLKVTAHNGESIVTVFGEKYKGEGAEMNSEAVVLRGERQSIADRTAATFRLIDTMADNFFALLDGAEACAICGRPLKDEISKLIAVEPDCARKYGVPHSCEAAERRLALRRRLLGESTRSEVLVKNDHRRSHSGLLATAATSSKTTH